jgi:hypothetical protein
MNNGERTSKKKEGQWTDDQMKLAVDKVWNKEPVSEAADTFPVPESSLGDRTKLQGGKMVKMKKIKQKEGNMTEKKLDAKTRLAVKLKHKKLAEKAAV